MATTTTNFGLNIVEGTDIVNPLIYDNPNYQKIDTQMFTNQNNGVPKATYSKAGTVHQISRSVKTANIFWFVASANFNAGDTFTVDGGSVTATLVNGEGLQTGAFAINSNVICVLNGSALTVFANAGVPEEVNYSKTTGKLNTPVNIGSASFDGSQSITLAQMGAFPSSFNEASSATLTANEYIESASVSYIKNNNIVYVFGGGLLSKDVPANTTINVAQNLPIPSNKYFMTTAPISFASISGGSSRISSSGQLGFFVPVTLSRLYGFYFSGFYYTDN